MVGYILFLILGLNFAAINAHQSISKKLDERMIVADSLVCVGLDPDISKLPFDILDIGKTNEQNVYSFLTTVIDITAPHACSFKLQKAFYDLFDEGHSLLRDTVAYIKEHYSDIPVFVDCKIGDTDNTMAAYMRLLFDDIKADAIVINPYMGDDVFDPFMEDVSKSAIVLVQTSNPRSKVVQEIVTEHGVPLWEAMLDLTINRWNVNSNLIVVLSSNTDSLRYKLIRKRIPQDMPILLAGIGLQGGDSRVLQDLLNDDKRGVFVNSSRGITYPYSRDDKEWRHAILEAVIELKNKLNEIRNS